MAYNEAVTVTIPELEYGLLVSSIKQNATITDSTNLEIVDIIVWYNDEVVTEIALPGSYRVCVLVQGKDDEYYFVNTHDSNPSALVPYYYENTANIVSGELGSPMMLVSSLGLGVASYDFSSSTLFTIDNRSTTETENIYLGMWKMFSVTGYSVYYEDNVDSEEITVPEDENSYLEGATVTISSTIPTRAGYAFTSWNTQQDGQGTSYSANGTFDMGNSNVTLYAQWEYSKNIEISFSGLIQDATTSNITITTNDSSNLSIERWNMIFNYSHVTSIEYTGTYTFNILLKNSTNIKFASSNNYDYDGEVTSTGNNVAEYNVCSSANNDLNEFYYSPATHEYIYVCIEVEVVGEYLIYDGNAGVDTVYDMPSSPNCFVGQQIEIDTETIPTRESYIFIGWNTNKNATDKETFTDNKITMVEDGITLYAIWEKIIKTQPTSSNDYTVVVGDHVTDVTYQWQKGTLEYEDATYDGLYYGSIGNNAYNPDNNTVNANTNSFFQVDDNDSNTILRFKYNGTGTITDCTQNGEYYYPTFDVEHNYFSVHIDNKGDNDQFTDIEVAVVTYSYIDGETNARLNSATENAYYCCEVTTDYETVYSDAFTTKEIKFNINDATSGTAPETIYQLEGRTITLPTNEFTKAGYKFLGWDASSSATTATYSAGETYTTGSSDVTLYAVWESLEYKEDITLTITSLVYNLETSDISISVNDSKLEATGFKLCYNNQEVNTITQPGLYTMYVIVEGVNDTYYFANKSNGGIDYYFGEISITGNTLYFSPSDMLFPYYLGVKSCDITSANDFFGEMSSNAYENVVLGLKLYFNLTGYSVTYEDNDEDNEITVPTDSNTYLENAPVTVLTTTPVRAGYTFLGWSLSSDGAVITTETVNMDSDGITFYAIWEEKDYISISFDWQEYYYDGNAHGYVLPDDCSDYTASSFVVRYYSDEDEDYTISDYSTFIEPGIYSVKITRAEDETYQAVEEWADFEIKKLEVTYNKVVQYIEKTSADQDIYYSNLEITTTFPSDASIEAEAKDLTVFTYYYSPAPDMYGRRHQISSHPTYLGKSAVVVTRAETDHYLGFEEYYNSVKTTYTLCIYALYTFDANGGVGTVPQPMRYYGNYYWYNDDDIEADKHYVPEVVELTKEGYVFVGWNTDPNATEPLGNYDLPQYSSTLYAIWQEVKESPITININNVTYGKTLSDFSFTFNDSNLILQRDYEYDDSNACYRLFTAGEEYELLDDSTVLGLGTYRIAVAIGLTDGVFFNTYNVTGETYTINFNGLTSTQILAETTNGCIGMLGYLDGGVYAEGYLNTTEGWYYDCYYKDGYIGYAKRLLIFFEFEIKELTIAYNSNSGSWTGTAPANVDTYSGSTISLLSQDIVSYANHSFLGWNTNPNATEGFTSYNALNADADADTDVITLYAIWEEKTAISIEENAQTVIFNGQSQNFELNGTDKDLNNFTIEYFVDGAYTTTAPINAGSYKVKITRAEDSTYQSYSKEIENGLVITAKEIVIDWGTQTFTYNGNIQSFTITYKNVENQDVNLHIYVTQNENSADFRNAGVYTIQVRFETGDFPATMLGNYKLPSVTTKSFTINKLLVTKPVEYTAQFIYTGDDQIYTLTASEYYTITNDTRKYAGTQNVTVALKDKSNYAWNDANKTTDDLTFVFTIAKAQNSITNLSVENVYCGTKINPTATSQFGNIIYNYQLSGSDTWAVLSDTNYPKKVGTYLLKAQVVETDDYAGATMDRTFEIFAKVIDDKDISEKDKAVEESQGELIEGSLGENVVIVVVKDNHTNSKKVNENVKTAVTEKSEIIAKFNIYLEQNGSKIENISGNRYRVTLVIPENLLNRTGYAIVSIDDSENVEKINSIMSDEKTIVFETDHFSNWAIVADATDNTLIIVIVGTCLLAVLVAIILMFLLRKRKITFIVDGDTIATLKLKPKKLIVLFGKIKDYAWFVDHGLKEKFVQQKMGYKSFKVYGKKEAKLPPKPKAIKPTKPTNTTKK